MDSHVITPRCRAAVLGLALLGAACGPEPARAPEGTPPETVEAPAAVPAGPTGRITGIVRFQGPRPAPETDPITENTDICGTSAELPRLALGPEGGVQDAFVYLHDVPGGATPRPARTLEIDQERCQYSPRALIVPVGTALDVVNSDPILHNVHGHALTLDGPKTVFNVAQPVQGQRNELPPLTDAGIVHLTCEAGHPWMSSYIFVAGDPYVTITERDGTFTIEDVPVGTYRITMWHPGIRLERNLKSLQRYEYEPPYETTQEVVVTEGGDAVVDFDLSLRTP